MFHNIGQVCPLTCRVLRSCWLGTDLPPLRVSLTSNLDPQVGTFGSRSWPHGMCRQGSSRTPRPQDSLPAEMWMCPFSGSMNHVHSLILVSLNLCKGFSPTFFPQLFRVGDVIAEALLTTLKKKKKKLPDFFFFLVRIQSAFSSAHVPGSKQNKLATPQRRTPLCLGAWRGG